MTAEAPATRYARFLEGLTADRLDDLASHVAPGVRFRDPFNDVVGIDAYRAVLADLFAAVDDVRFQVTGLMGDERRGMMAWTLQGRLRGRPWRVEGMSDIDFDENGLVVRHVDHWDAAGQLYERFAVIGWLLATLRRRLASRPPRPGGSPPGRPA